MTLEKWAKYWNRHFSEGHIHMAGKYMKKYSMSLIIREMPIKTTVCQDGWLLSKK